MKSQSLFDGLLRALTMSVLAHIHPSGRAIPNQQIIAKMEKVLGKLLSVQLKMPYNTLYNVSVISIDPCKQNSVFEIYYGELNHI